MSRELVQGSHQNVAFPLPSITFAIHHSYDEQSFRSSAFWHIFLEGITGYFCQQGELYDFRVVGEFCLRPFFHCYGFLCCLSLKFFTVLECLKHLLILVIMDTS